jgi:hypothetical protein
MAMKREAEKKKGKPQTGLVSKRKQGESRT